MRFWGATIVLCACLAPDDSAGVDGGGLADAQATSYRITITAPATLARNDLYPDGSWVARAVFKAQVTPAASQIDWMAGGSVRGVGLPPDYAFEAIYTAEGTQAVSAVVHDPHGAELGRADTTLTVTASTGQGQDCRGQLDAIGLSYSIGPATMGIADPVTVTLPLDGMKLMAAGAEIPSLVMDCDMALALWRTVGVLRNHDVTAVEGGGSGLYNYRCVSGSEQPPCAQSGFSLHAYGKAFDLAAVTTSDGLDASVAIDWVADSGATCTASSADPKNQRLHDVVCDLFANGIFSVVLTPNYQAQQTFVHVDLTADQSVIK